ESVEERIAKTLGRMGPSILLSALSETIAFGLGGIVTMPAVRNFALYAALAVWVDFSLQVTVFIAFLSLDAKRQEEDRLDCFPCISIEGAPGRIDREGTLQKWMRKYYAPVILNRKVKISIVAFFLGLFMVGLSLVPRVELGLGKLYFLLTLFHTNKVNRVPILKTELSNLTFNTKIFKSDQRIALPSDSYLVDYFDDLDDYFRVGPPVYFVAKNVNTSKIQGQQALCGRFSTCSQLSLANILEQERKRPKVSYIAEPSAVWIDDFLYWLNPSFEACCRIKKDSDPTELCDIYDDDCDVCFQDREPKWNITMDGFPQGEEFSRYINLWIKATPDELCPLAGKAAYGNAIRFSEDNKTVVASHFRTFHTPLKSQQDYISAHHSAKRISNLIQEKNPGVEVFPYSVFYIFFDQYEHIVQLATVILSLAFISIWLVTALLLGSMWTGFIVMCHVIMIVTDVLGVMALWNVSLNA
ncbi:4506_t:CDS:1, partial [Acaulospora morrowiae]